MPKTNITIQLDSLGRLLFALLNTARCRPAAAASVHLQVLCLEAANLADVAYAQTSDIDERALLRDSAAILRTRASQL